MSKREGWKLMRSGGDQVSWSKSKIHPWQFVCARTVEDVEDPELYSLGNTPGRNVLAADAIFELRFMLEDKNARTALRHGSGERRCCEAAANSDKVKMCHVHRAVGALQSMFRRNLLSDPENGTIVLSSARDSLKRNLIGSKPVAELPGREQSKERAVNFRKQIDFQR